MEWSSFNKIGAFLNQGKPRYLIRAKNLNKLLRFGAVFHCYC